MVTIPWVVFHICLSYDILIGIKCILSQTHSVHDHAADLQDGHVGLLALISLPYYGAHSLQTRVGAMQPGNMSLFGGGGAHNKDSHVIIDLCVYCY